MFSMLFASLVAPLVVPTRGGDEKRSLFMGCYNSTDHSFSPGNRERTAKATIQTQTRADFKLEKSPHTKRGVTAMQDARQ